MTGFPSNQKLTNEKKPEMTSDRNEGIKSRIVVGVDSQMNRWMRRRRKRRKMAEKLPDVVVIEQMDDAPSSYEDTQTSEAESIIAETKSKADADRKEMKERLDQAKQVKEKAGESLYNSLFAMLVQDCVDSILKKEMVYLTMEMCRFRNNISEKILADESRADAPMNIAGLHEGFAEAWKIWRDGDTEEAWDPRGE